MKKLALSPLELDKETIALLDANQLLDIIGGGKWPLLSGASTNCCTGGSYCPGGGSGACTAGSSQCISGRDQLQ